MSRPTWARGLKQQLQRWLPVLRDVAPHVGAWIETGLKVITILDEESRPTWARGLKHTSRQCA